MDAMSGRGKLGDLGDQGRLDKLEDWGGMVDLYGLGRLGAILD